MISLSTSWNSSRHNNGLDLIKEIKAAGFDTVELNFALTGKITDEILSIKESGGIKVSSLHNMCPLPAEIDPGKASPDYYSLSSCDNVERGRAVEAAKRTIEYADRFGASAIVLHAGRVEIKDRTRELASLVGRSDAFAELRNEIVAQRFKVRDAYLDNVMRSLEELIPFARKTGVAIGIENRYYYREIPVIDELEAIFARFGKDELYYWHDVGHAEVFDRLGLCSHKDLLDKFSDRLIGLHLHDIIGPISDHKAPGQGTFDFRIVKPYIRPDTIMVMEVHQPAESEDIRRGLGHLMTIFGKAR